MPAELGLSPDTQADVAVPVLVEAARDAGFTTVGLEASRIDGEAATTLSRAGLRCHEVVALLVWAEEEALLAAAGRVAEAAAAVGAPWVLTAFATPLTAEMATLIKQCAAILADRGTAMAVEFSPLSPVATIPDALEVVDAAGADRAGVLIDSWHLRGDSGWADLAAIPLERIAYVQFTDMLAPVSDNPMEETMHRRALPGDGVLDLHRFARTLLDRGWEGLVSVEVLSREMRELPVSEYARLAYDRSARYWLS